MDEKPKRRSEDDMNWIRRNWELLVFILGVIFGAGAWYNTMANHEPRICTLETKVDSIAVMKTDIDWIKKGVDELKSRSR
jgi:hypothetical protein